MCYGQFPQRAASGSATVPETSDPHLYYTYYPSAVKALECYCSTPWRADCSWGAVAAATRQPNSMRNVAAIFTAATDCCGLPVAVRLPNSHLRSANGSNNRDAGVWGSKAASVAAAACM
jgi:hypothetical protein